MHQYTSLYTYVDIKPYTPGYSVSVFVSVRIALMLQPLILRRECVNPLEPSGSFSSRFKQCYSYESTVFDVAFNGLMHKCFYLQPEREDVPDIETMSEADILEYVLESLTVPTQTCRKMVRLGGSYCAKKLEAEK